jgi:hypothetical protein
VASGKSQLKGKKGIGFSILPPEVVSSPQRRHLKQASGTHIPRNFRNTGPKLFWVSEIRTQVLKLTEMRMKKKRNEVPNPESHEI